MIKIDPSKCNKDYICIDECAYGFMYEKDDEGYPVIRPSLFEKYYVSLWRMIMKFFYIAFLSLFTLNTPAFSESRRLDVPHVKQSVGRLCGPASIEMVFTFWGDDRFDQYEIARQIATEFSNEKRFINCDYLENLNPNSYPGTPAYIMRRYLNNRAHSEKYSLKELPSNASLLDREFSKVLGWIKKYLDNGVPIIIHQYWKSKKSTGHYRVVTGYDDEKKLIYLNDPKIGKITQSYLDFKNKGAVKGRWMPYYSIAFNSNKTDAPF